MAIAAKVYYLLLLPFNLPTFITLHDYVKKNAQKEEDDLKMQNNCANSG